jgi:hypothetical protein
MLKWVVIVVWSREADSGGPEYKISELDCETACSLKAVILQDPFGMQNLNMYYTF